MNSIINFIAHLFSFWFIFFIASAVGGVLKKNSKSQKDRRTVIIGFVICIIIYILSVHYIR